MTETEPLAAFDDELIESVAVTERLDVTALRDALRRQQEHARSIPGVDDLVYEWRRFLPYDPLVYRASDAYYLVFTASVWEEFGEQLSFDSTTLAAVREAHDRQVRRALRTLGEDESVVDGGAAMVLTR